jgi:hypothetical protein
MHLLAETAPLDFDTVAGYFNRTSGILYVALDGRNSPRRNATRRKHTLAFFI